MRNFDIRKNLLKFDDVMNDQRKVIYEQRREIMQGDDYTDTISDMILSVIEELVEEHIPRDTYLEQWDLVNLDKKILHFFDLNLDVEKFAQKEGVAQEDIFEFIKDACINKYQALQKKHSADVVARAERHFLLLTLDQLWKEHLHSLDHLRQGINLRAYGQKDPLNEYKKEAFLLFDGMLSNLRKVVVGRLFHVVIEVTTEKPHKKAPMQETRTDPALLNHSTTDAKLGRNDLCHCGSGLKYKHCHGKL